MQSLKQKFLKAIDSGRGKLEVGEKSWYSYKLNIQKLVWARNLMDGWNIYIFDKRISQLGEITIDNNLGKITFKTI